MAALMAVDEAIICACLPDYLSIYQWPQVIHRDPDNQIDCDDRVKKKILKIKRKKESDELIDACKAGLKYEGNIDGWTYGNTNPHPLTDNGISNGRMTMARRIPGTGNWRVGYSGDTRTTYKRPPTDCVIHKSVMQPYLKSVGKWPLKVEGLPDSYWHDGKPEAGRIRTSAPKLGGLMQGVDLSEFIPFFKARELLASRLQATRDEIAQWVSIGKDGGGLNAYRSPDKENLFTFAIRYFLKNDDYLTPLLVLWFLKDDIETFNPDTRYITRKALIGRWTMQCGGAVQAEVFIRDVRLPEYHPKDVRLTEYHPIVGEVDSEGELFRNGLFDLSEVRAVEESHGFTGQELDKSLGDAGIGNPRLGKYNTCDKFTISFVEQNPEKRFLAKRVLSDELTKRECFKSINFDEWWKGNPVFPPGKSGRPKGSKNPIK